MPKLRDEARVVLFSHVIMRIQPARRKGTAILALVAMVASPLQTGFAAQAKPAPPTQATTQPKPATTAKPAGTSTAKPAPTAAAGTANAAIPGDQGWPRAYVTPAGAQMLIYQPQVASWDGRQHMVAHAAVSYQAKGAKQPSLGAVKLEAETSVSLEDRLVKFTKLKIAEANFGSLDKTQVRDLVTEIESAIPEAERIIGLDRVLAQVDKSLIAVKDVAGVKADPPAIYYSTKPAVLLNFDGDPIWSPIRENDLKFAVNTNWDVFLHDPTKTYYLRNDKMWMKTTDLLKGTWSAAGVLPASFSKLPAEENWKDVKASLPGVGGALPAVYVSTSPAELILVRGNPSYTSVTGTDLWWLSNTDADVFRLGASGPVYFLVSGRWFTARSFTGPWTFATPSLPADFKKISLEHPRSRVLASVPGTSQAAEAVLLATVPQTARVNKKELKAPDVAYSGEPQFQAIEKTTVARATNTDKDVIKVGDMYYLCFQGVWFMSKNAKGPWEIAETVPSQIYEIPASSPAHNVTYVTVVEDDDDDWVTFAAVAGYTGMMVAWGCAVWGTGYYYPPYIGYGGFYPVYYPFYPTYGAGAWYNPWTGGYGRGAAWYGPYGGAGVGARYNPSTGVYSRGAAAWGPYGARGAAEAYNPRTGTYARTNQGAGVYGSWGSTSVQRGNQWAQTARVTNRATGATTRVTQGSGGGSAVTRNGIGPGNNSGVVRTGSGDVYAGRDGNVYRKDAGGDWQRYDNGSWGSAGTPRDAGTATTQQLDRDRTSRTDGTTRTRDYGAARSGGSGATSTYRPSSGGARSGGAMRGGGGRRR